MASTQFQLPPGVSGNRGLVLNAAQVDFLRALRANVPPSIPLYVTSATRTAATQAKALVTKRSLGDNLYKLYRADHIIKELMAVPNTVDAMAPIIERYAQAGQFLSRHMRADAVDLRNRDLTPDQRRIVIAAATALGAKVIEETKPPHIHAEGIGGVLSNVQLAVTEKAGRAQRVILEKGAQTTRRAKRAARRARTLYTQRKILYTLSAVGGATVLVALIALAMKKPKQIEAR